MVLYTNPFSILSFPQEAALDLGVLTEQEFHELVVPEKMIGPSD
jgi:fumarate hydratase class II